MKGLVRFLEESNRIEGIVRPVTDAEAAAALAFIDAPTVTIAMLAGLVGVFQLGARLRDKPGLNVRVGTHVPAPGGPEIRETLEMFLPQIDGGKWTPYDAHQQYETLHPFTDGNGRSGRMLWLWQHVNRGTGELALRRGFLHSWYYESLDASRADAAPC